MALTSEEKQIRDFGAKAGKSETQVLDAIRKYRRSIQPKEAKSGFLATLRDIPSDVRETFTGAVEDVRGGIETAEEARTQVETGEISPLAGTAKTIGGGLSAGAGVIGRGVLGLAKSFVSPRTEEKVTGLVETGAQKVVETEPVQNLIQRYEGLSQQQKAVVDGLLGTTEGLATIVGAGPVTGALRQGVSRSSDLLSLGVKQTGTLVERVTPTTFKRLINQAPAQSRQEAVDSMTSTFEKSFLGKKSVLDKIEKRARRAGVTETDMLRELVNEGGIPNVQDDIARFGAVIDDFSLRQDNLVDAIHARLKPVIELTDLNSLRVEAERIMRTSDFVGAELNKSLKELTNIFDSLENRFGSSLSAQQVNTIRVQMNRKTGAFKGELFTQDTADAIADATRKRLDEIAPSVREANAEWAKLQGLKATAGALNNQKIDIGLLGSSVGSYVAASALGASGIATGSASLVIAGLVATLGGKTFANFLRRLKFNDPIRKTIAEGLRQDEEVVKKLLAEVSEADKELINRLLLPERAGPSSD